MEKHMEYAVLIANQIEEMFEENAQHYIDQQELLDSDNFKAFLHALATMVPGRFFNKYTKSNKSQLEFNHIANSLAFEFSQLEKK